MVELQRKLHSLKHWFYGIINIEPNDVVYIVVDGAYYTKCIYCSRKTYFCAYGDFAKTIGMQHHDI